MYFFLVFRFLVRSNYKKGTYCLYSVICQNIIRNGGDGEIRTHGTVRPYDTLARCCLRPLGHISIIKMAEDTGFEPADPLRSMVFKTTAFDHSANPPRGS